jgi:hypothetical protein
VTDEEISEKVAAMSPEEVRDSVAALAPTFFGVVPLEVTDGTAGFSIYEPWSRAAVGGTTFYPIGGREDGTLVVGGDGASWTSDDDRVRTVRWDDAVCSFTWDDGRRSLQGPHGEWVFIVPWCWRGGHHLTERVDAAVGVERQIRLGEGETQYLQDPRDPESHVDVRWLASVIGARHRGAPVDLVIDTDGFFLLHSRQTRDSIQFRMRYLAKSDRLTLLSGDERNRWVPQHEIELVELTKRALHRLRGARAVLVIRLRDGSVLDVQLRDAGDDKVAGDAFRLMLGPLFQATTTSVWSGEHQF